MKFADRSSLVVRAAAVAGVRRAPRERRRARSGRGAAASPRRCEAWCCAHCGVHLPRSEALPGARRRTYCESRAHRAEPAATGSSAAMSDAPRHRRAAPGDRRSADRRAAMRAAPRAGRRVAVRCARCPRRTRELATTVRRDAARVALRRRLARDRRAGRLALPVAPGPPHRRLGQHHASSACTAPSSAARAALGLRCCAGAGRRATCSASARRWPSTLIVHARTRRRRSRCGCCRACAARAAQRMTRLTQPAMAGDDRRRPAGLRGAAPVRRRRRA